MPCSFLHLVAETVGIMGRSITSVVVPDPVKDLGQEQDHQKTTNESCLTIKRPVKEHIRRPLVKIDHVHVESKRNRARKKGYVAKNCVDAG